MALSEIDVAGIADLVAELLAGGASGIRWFRGQGCTTHQLRSSLWRRLSGKPPTDVLKAEQRLITRFRQRSLPYWPEGYPQKDWEHLFAMQHFGIPTRLLDWTESLMVGLFFALDHDPARCYCGTGACVPTVWVLDPVKFNNLNARLSGMDLGILTTSNEELEPWAPGVDERRWAPAPVAMYGTHNSPRIVAQQGTFTVDGRDGAPLQEAPAVADNDGVLTKYHLSGDPTQLRQQLHLLGVSRAAVYPDLAGLAADITDMELP